MFFKKIDFSKYEPTDQDTLRACFDELELSGYEILEKDDFLLRPRMSRIYYKKKYFDYPLKASNALFNLGIFEALRCVLSYVYVKINPPKKQDNFEDLSLIHI